MKLTKTEKAGLFTKHANIVNKMAHSFNKTTGCDFDDLQSEGNIAMFNAFDKFDEDKGYCLSTLVYRYVSTALLTFSRKQMKHTPICYDDNIYTSHGFAAAGNTEKQGQEGKYEFLEGLAGIGEEAKMIAGIVLDSPAEALGIALDSSPTKIRVAIKKHMAALGFTKKATLGGINEIKCLLA